MCSLANFGKFVLCIIILLLLLCVFMCIVFYHSNQSTYSINHMKSRFIPYKWCEIFVNIKTLFCSFLISDSSSATLEVCRLWSHGWDSGAESRFSWWIHSVNSYNLGNLLWMKFCQFVFLSVFCKLSIWS